MSESLGDTRPSRETCDMMRRIYPDRPICTATHYGDIMTDVLDDARIQNDLSRVRHTYGHIAKLETFETWLDAPAPAWKGLTARQMVTAGRAGEVIDMIDAIYSGAYM